MVRTFLILAFAIFATSWTGLLTGSPPAASAPVVAVTDLEVPWRCGESYVVGQGHGSKSHQGPNHFAWDFTTPKSTLVTAPADGTVRLVRDDSTTYGCDRSYAWDANYVVIDLGDGHEVLLLHLHAGSALVEPGQAVETGQPIGRVGNSGYVCGTHLHVQVQKNCDQWWCPSVPAAFGGDRIPEAGTALSRSNC